MEEKLVWGIRIARAVSAVLEVTIALALWRMTDARSMLRLNAMLGMAGPLVFITVSALGLAATVDRLQPHKLGMVFLGIVMVILGTR